MACTLSNKCAKNLSKQTVVLQLIIKNVVTCFFLEHRCTKIRAVLTGGLTVSGFDLAWFSSLSSKHLCVFGLNGAIYVKKNFCLHPSLYHLVS